MDEYCYKYQTLAAIVYYLGRACKVKMDELEILKFQDNARMLSQIVLEHNLVFL